MDGSFFQRIFGGTWQSDPNEVIDLTQDTGAGLRYNDSGSSGSLSQGFSSDSGNGFGGPLAAVLRLEPSSIDSDEEEKKEAVSSSSGQRGGVGVRLIVDPRVKYPPRGRVKGVIPRKMPDEDLNDFEDGGAIPTMAGYAFQGALHPPALQLSWVGNRQIRGPHPEDNNKTTVYKGTVAVLKEAFYDRYDAEAAAKAGRKLWTSQGRGTLPLESDKQYHVKLNGLERGRLVDTEFTQIATYLGTAGVTLDSFSELAKMLPDTVNFKQQREIQGMRDNMHAYTLALCYTLQHNGLEPIATQVLVGDRTSRLGTGVDLLCRKKGWSTKSTNVILLEIKTGFDKYNNEVYPAGSKMHAPFGAYDAHAKNIHLLQVAFTVVFFEQTYHRHTVSDAFVVRIHKTGVETNKLPADMLSKARGAGLRRLRTLRQLDGQRLPRGPDSDDSDDDDGDGWGDRSRGGVPRASSSQPALSRSGVGGSGSGAAGAGPSRRVARPKRKSIARKSSKSPARSRSRSKSKTKAQAKVKPKSKSASQKVRSLQPPVFRGWTYSKESWSLDQLVANQTNIRLVFRWDDPDGWSQSTPIKRGTGRAANRLYVNYPGYGRVTHKLDEGLYKSLDQTGGWFVLFRNGWQH